MVELNGPSFISSLVCKEKIKYTLMMEGGGEKPPGRNFFTKKGGVGKDFETNLKKSSQERDLKLHLHFLELPFLATGYLWENKRCTSKKNRIQKREKFKNMGAEQRIVSLFYTVLPEKKLTRTKKPV